MKLVGLASPSAHAGDSHPGLSGMQLTRTQYWGDKADEVVLRGTLQEESLWDRTQRKMKACGWGKIWASLDQEAPGVAAQRNQNAIASYWTEQLDRDLVRTDFTSREMEFVIAQSANEMGAAAIAKKMPGRNGPMVRKARTMEASRLLALLP